MKLCIFVSYMSKPIVFTPVMLMKRIRVTETKLSGKLSSMIHIKFSYLIYLLTIQKDYLKAAKCASDSEE